MINFNFPILKNKFKQNSKIKKELLKLIDEQKSGELKQRCWLRWMCYKKYLVSTI